MSTPKRKRPCPGAAHAHTAELEALCQETSTSGGALVASATIAHAHSAELEPLCQEISTSGGAFVAIAVIQRQASNVIILIVGSMCFLKTTVNVTNRLERKHEIYELRMGLVLWVPGSPQRCAPCPGNPIYPETLQSRRTGNPGP